MSTQFSRIPDIGISVREARIILIMAGQKNVVFVKWLEKILRERGFQESWRALYNLLRRMEQRGFIMRVQKPVKGNWGHYAWYMPTMEGIQKARQAIDWLSNKLESDAETETVTDTVSETVTNAVTEAVNE